MYNKRTAFVFIIFMMVFLLYLSGGTVAMAASEQAEDFTAENVVSSVSENHVDLAPPVPETVEPPVFVEEDDAPSVPEIDEPSVSTEENAALSISENNIRQASVRMKNETVDGSPGTPPSAEQSEFISDGESFWAWLEAHLETGGFARLTNPICLDTDNTFLRVGTETAAQLVVDTAGYTVTVTGAVDMWSNQQLTFRGQASENGIFHVASGGVLELNGIVVEGTPPGEALPDAVPGCVLWQEEGAALAIDNCRISGTVHYAQTPFVMYDNSVYAVARTGQTADDVLPTEISCTVNCQGTLTNRPVQVVWNLEGTQKQQEERLRFVAKGAYVNEASGSAPLCTVIYDDYPLTFTYVKAGANNGYFSFKGGYTRPEEYAPMTIASEYSFDGDNWLVYDEKTVTEGAPDTFFMGFQGRARSEELSPYVYIRLRGEYNGTCYLSNVLCYASDSLSLTEEAGGNRGGGTSVVNPPAAPEEKPVNRPGTPPAADSGDTTASDTNRGNINNQSAGNTASSGTTGSTDSGSTDSGTTVNQSAGSTTSSSTTGSTADNKTNNGTTGNTPAVTADSDNTSQQQDGITIASGTDDKATGYGDVTSAAQDGTNPSAEADALSKADTDIRKTPDRLYVAAVCFITLSVIAGAAGFAVHAGIFRRAFHVVRRAWFK